MLDRTWGAEQIAEALRVPAAMVQSVLDDPTHQFASLAIERCRTVPVNTDALDPALVAYVDGQYRAHMASVRAEVAHVLEAVRADTFAVKLQLRLLDTWILQQGGNMADEWRRAKKQAAQERLRGE